MDQGLNTKRLLANTLTEMMAEKPFDRITVSELTKRCGVNRQTFYYHFETIADLLLWMLQEEGWTLLGGITADPFDWKDAILRCLYYVRDHRASVLCALQSVRNQQIRAFFIEYFII